MGVESRSEKGALYNPVKISHKAQVTLYCGGLYLYVFDF